MEWTDDWGVRPMIYIPKDTIKLIDDARALAIIKKYNKEFPRCVIEIPALALTDEEFKTLVNNNLVSEHIIKQRKI